MLYAAAGEIAAAFIVKVGDEWYNITVGGEKYD